MTITRISSNERLSGAVTFNDLVFLSGQVPGDGLDVATQTREVLARIDALLAQAGSDKSKILRAQIYLPNLSDFPRMNEVWEKWVVPGHTPTRATVQAALANPKWKIEVVITAAV